MSPVGVRLAATALVAGAVASAVAGEAITISDGVRPGRSDAFVWALLLAFTVGGRVIAARQPGNAIGWLFLVVGASVGLASLAGSYGDQWVESGARPSLLSDLALVYADNGWIPFILIPATFLLLLFPDGHLLTRRWRTVAWCAGVGIVGVFIGECLTPGALDDHPGTPNPFGIDGPAPNLVDSSSYLALAVGLFGSATSLVLRFRRAHGDERQQMKWIALAGAVAAVTFPVMLVTYDLVGEHVADSVIMLSSLGLPAATAVAVLRYRLYDIDVVINRTLVYGSLTATLAAVYVGSVLLLQLVLSGLTQGSGLAVAASTLAVAALFRPVRGRIQSTVDQRFFRSKYDAVQTLQAFGAQLRDEVDIDSLSADLRAAVVETMRPAHVSLWLRERELST